MARQTVSVITTVYNEEDAIGPLLDSIMAQTRQADEVVIVDAGSSDGTVDIIQERISEGLPARVIVEPGANRSRGRNRAIQEASGQVIASIDGGCTASKEWLAELVAPFESDAPPDVVAGYYEPDTDCVMEDAIAAATVPGVSEVDPRSFLPSSRSVAFRRKAWQQVSGCPEYVAYAEDTAFNLRLRGAGCRFVFRPQARVSWRMQRTLPEVFRQFFRYARSDGELGHWFGHYTKAVSGFLLLAALLVLANLGPTMRLGSYLVALALVAYWWRYTWRARRRGAEWWPALLSPTVSLTVDLANLSGYLTGLVSARPRPRPLPVNRGLSVAQITYTYRPIGGGADVYVSQVAGLVGAGGHQHCVYQRVAETDAEDVRFVRNPWRGLPLEFWTHALALFRLRRELLSHDVVICHYPHYLLAVDLMSFFGRRPIRIGISHGVFWDDAPRSLRSRVKALLTKLAFRRAHLYIANDTHFLRAMGVRIAPRQGMHSQVAPGVWFIPNGVDARVFGPVEPDPSVSVREAVLVPRNLFYNRGIHLAIAAFAQFRRAYPATTLLIVGGSGQPRYREILRRDVRRRDLESAVVFHGAVSHDRMPAVYAAAQLTLIPSLCGEGTSLSALESMACGTATVCTNVAGLLDLPGPHALPVAHSLAEVMRQVYDNRARVGEEQRGEALSAYSISAWRRAWQAALAGVGVPCS